MSFPAAAHQLAAPSAARRVPVFHHWRHKQPRVPAACQLRHDAERRLWAQLQHDLGGGVGHRGQPLKEPVGQLGGGGGGGRDVGVGRTPGEHRWQGTGLQ